MDCSTHQALFESALEGFRGGLEGRDIRDFKATTLEVLERSIVDLQSRQHSQRQLQNLNRLQPYLEAIKEFGEVTREFCDNNDIISFLWGPLKFLLKETSGVVEAFGELLSAYEEIGGNLPFLMQYQETFRTKPHLVRILSHIYVDILEFQRIILRYFQQSEWKQVFAESWSVCKFRFDGIFLQIARRRSLIESEASITQIEEAQRDIQQSRRIEDDQFNEQNLHRLRDVYSWLDAACVETDQLEFSNIRAEYPGSGQWLLENSLFKDWFHPKYVTIPPLLWLNGMPGAGKTILASLVIEEAQKLTPAPTVLYFFCQHGNSKRDNFVALGRSLLKQFLDQDNGLLPTLYQKSCRSGEATLTSPGLVKELLSLAFANCKNAYIILDGLDECPREQRKEITHWFKKLIEDLPSSKPERLRCLFVSQDDGPARKDFDGIAHIKVESKDNQADIERYCKAKAETLQQDFHLDDEEASEIATKVANSVQGLFLLARLIWDNLSGQSSVAALEKELEPNAFPNTINDAYSRIMFRISQQTPPTAMEDTWRLLGWLVCAKRPLKWYEIQGMKSIDLEGGFIEIPRQGFAKSAKDLGASLLEIRSDGSVELIHLTAKFFLIDEGHIDPAAEELRIAASCINYLNLPAFTNRPTEDRVLNGDYGFMEYAVLYWLRHLETGVTLKTENHEKFMNDVAESLGVFVDAHWNAPSANLSLARRHGDKLQFFRAFPFYDKLEQAVSSTRRQLKTFGKIKKEEIALNLVDVVADVRKVLEPMTSTANNETLREKYGDNLFKCPRFSCQFFTAGFSSRCEQEKHIGKHERPFRCPDENCTGFTWGFASVPEREKHMKEYHYTAANEDEEFPTDQDVERSIINDNPVVNQVQVENVGDAIATTTEDPESGPEPEPVPQYLARHKRQRQTEFRCPHCPRVFNKRYNLNSHLDSHGNSRSYTCHICGQQSARPGDHRRHVGTHTGENRSVCQVCKKSFARADILKKHYESRVGRACFQYLQQQEEQQE